MRTRNRLYRKLVVSSSLAVLLLVFSVDDLSTALVSRTGAQRHEADEKRISMSGLNSPSDIERYVNKHNGEVDLDAIWEEFGIVTESGSPGRCGCLEDGCLGTCRAKAIPVDTREGDPEYEILRLCYADELACWFLLFKKEGNWKFVKAAESMENKYEEVKHRVVSCNDNRWLVVRAGNGGTGFTSFEERWFGISSNAFSEVLSYPVSGHSVQGEADDYELSSTIPTEAAGADCIVVVHYDIQRDSLHNPEFHWSNSVKQTIQFFWNARAGRFVLDMPNSDFSDRRHPPVTEYLIRHGYWDWGKRG